MLAAAVLGAILAIDRVQSHARFAVPHIFVSDVHGTVPIASGSIDLPSGSRIPTHVEAVLDARGLTTGNADRDAALAGPDWFDTARYPQWSFVSTAIVPATNGFTMSGRLNIHGVWQPEVIHVVVSGDAAHPYFRGTCAIDRHAFGMKRVPLDPVIGNPVSVTLEIAVK